MSRFSVWILAIFASAWTSLAFGQEPDTKTAVELAQEAKGKYDRGDWKGALALFEAAESHTHSPVLWLYAARCNRNLGKLLVARQILERVRDEPLAEDASEPFRGAQRDAAADLTALQGRIPTIAIDRTRAPDAWQVSIDGAVLTESSVAVDPGEHVVRAGAGDAIGFERTVTVAEAKRITIIIVDSRRRAAPKPPSETAPEPYNPLPLIPGIVFATVGLAAVAVGVGLRVAALNTVADVKARCIDNSCLASDADEIEKAETYQTVSTLLFVLGGAVAATGVALIIILPNIDEWHASLELGPGYLGVRGAF